MTTHKIARVFLGVHMGQNFRGLLKLAHDSGIRPEETSHSYLVFINGKRSKFKVLVGNKYLVYHDNGARAFPLDAIRFLPKAFSGETFTFDKAVRELLLEKKGKKEGKAKETTGA